MNNAVKYAPESDEIIFYVDFLKKFINVSVIDLRSGIPAESLEKLFDRYYQVDENTKEISDLGLGLYKKSETIKCHGLAYSFAY